MIAFQNDVHAISVFLRCGDMTSLAYLKHLYTVELQWLEHLWNDENMFETGVVRAIEFLS